MTDSASNKKSLGEESCEKKKIKRNEAKDHAWKEMVKKRTKK